MFRLMMMVLGCFFSLHVAAETLETQPYIVNIQSLCGEGHVSCNNVSYYGESKVSGRSISLLGETRHATCKDGVTPCRFLGYEFLNGSYTYFLSAMGELLVLKNGHELLVHEAGVWDR